MKPNLSTVCLVAACSSAAFLLGRMNSRQESAAGQTGGLTGNSPRRMADEGARPASSGKSTVDRKGKAPVRGGAKDRSSELASILRNADAIERNRALIDWMDQFDPAELGDAIRNFRALGITNQRQGEYGMLLSYWARKDPLAALADATTQPNSDGAVRTILSTWAANDPDAALAWVESSRPGDANNPFLAAVLGNLVTSDPARVSELLGHMPAGREQDRAISEILRNALVQGPQAARDWIGSIQDLALRDNAIVQVAGDMSRVDPQGTAKWLASLGTAGSEQGVFHMMAVWSEQNPGAAAQYYQSLPSGAARSNALGGMVASAAQNDPTAAAALLERHPEDVSDLVVSQFVRSSSRADPALAASYIGRITDPAQQRDAFDRVLSRWMKRDQAAAVAWIQTNPVPADIQRDLGVIK